MEEKQIDTVGDLLAFINERVNKGEITAKTKIMDFRHGFENISVAFERYSPRHREHGYNHVLLIKTKEKSYFRTGF